MKKYNIYVFLLVIITGFSACEIDLESLTEPTDDTFYSNKEELDLALTGCYNSMNNLKAWHVPLLTLVLENSSTDIAVARACEGHRGFGDQPVGSHSASTQIYLIVYKNCYIGIERVNSLIGNMERAKDLVDPADYAVIQAQALVIRAYHYMYLTELFGDVPLVLESLDPEEALIPRTAKNSVVDAILQDLETASASLPDSWPSEQGRIDKATALALKSRIALYNNRYDVAAAAAKTIIDNEAAMGLSLHPDYGELFNSAGVNSSEIILARVLRDNFLLYRYPQTQGSRNCGGYSLMTPTQSMIDSYEGTDGKPIDESVVYNPQQPFENRDPRLEASIILPGTSWAGIIYESHPDSVTLRDADGKDLGANKDAYKTVWAAGFTGYLWKKYTIEELQATKNIWSDYPFMVMRYAEVFLNYAEAKIELGQIDNSVLDAINRIRARAYGVDVSNTTSYPAISTNDQAELRKIIRRERKVELANEGFRFFDIRRWRIAEKVMPVTIYGRILDPSIATGVPQIDDDCFVSYDGIEDQYYLNTEPRFSNAHGRVFNISRDYLCPIPQQEIDTYKGMGATLEQNPGY